MMESLYKILSRIEFYVLLIVIATAAMFFAVFKDLPNSANHYSPTVRETPVRSLLLIGIFVFLSGIVTFFVVRTRARPKEKESFDPKVSAEELLWEDNLVATYKDFPKTQQRIVTLICEMPPVQMPIDDFWKAFTSRFGATWVSAEPEMKYRIEVLSLKGFCELRKIGPGASVVIRSQRVSKCLRSRDVLVS